MHAIKRLINLWLLSPLLLLVCAHALGAETVLGNGRLTLRVDETGGLSSCYWPSPTHHQQLAMGNPNARGTAHWKTLLPGGAQQQLDPSTSETQSTADIPVFLRQFNAGGVTIRQTAFVHASHDLFVSHLELEGAPPALRLVWQQQFAPATSPAAGLLSALGLPAPAGFASYSPAPDLLVQFRPKQPGQALWDRAEELASMPGDGSGWRKFGEGVWIVSAVVGESARAFFEAEGEAQAALGLASCGIEFSPAVDSRGAAATVLIAFGQTLEEAEQHIAFGLSKPVAEMQAETGEYWNAWLEASPPPAGVEVGLWHEALLRMMLSTDLQTGATATLPAPATKLAAVDPAALAPVAMAYGAAAKQAEAGAGILWYLRQAGDGSAGTYGSIPPLLRTDGTAVLPAALHDVQGPGWMLAAALRHLTSLDESARKEFVEAIDAPLQRLGDFLASWVHSGSGDLLPAYDHEVRRDALTQESRLIAWMGLACAQRLTELSGAMAPETWRDRMGDLETQLRFQVLHKSSAWEIDPLLAPLLERVLPDQRAVWGPVVQAAEPEQVLEAEVPGFDSATSAALFCLRESARVYGHL